MMRLFRKYSTDPHENVLQTVGFVLNHFGARHTIRKLRQDIAGHPEDRSLLAVKDLLSEYDIQSTAIRKSHYPYTEFEVPFVCALQQEGWPQAAFTVVTDCSPDKATFLDPTDNRIKNCSLQELEKMDKGIKQWCPLCLSVQVPLGISALSAGLFLYQQGSLMSIGFQPVFNMFFLGAVLLLSTYYAIPAWKGAREARHYEKKWKKLRFQPDVFQSLLKKNTPVTLSPEGLGIVVGNPDAKNEIIKVCNPYCGPCSKVHPELERIVASCSPDVRLRIVFTASGEEEDYRTRLVAHLLAIQEKHGHQTVQQALDDWYLAPEKDYKAFAAKHPMNGELKRQNDKIYAMRDWCEGMKIRATPTLFVNGYELPDSYRVDELENFF